MKIFSRLVALICLILLAWVLIQNIDFMVDVNFFDRSYTDVKLALVILFSVAAGLIMGLLLMAIIALKYKAEYIKEMKKQKLLMKELDSLRNLSIDEISLDESDDLADDHTIGIQIVDKKNSGTSAGAKE